MRRRRPRSRRRRRNRPNRRQPSARTAGAEGCRVFWAGRTSGCGKAPPALVIVSHRRATVSLWKNQRHSAGVHDAGATCRLTSSRCERSRARSVSRTAATARRPTNDCGTSATASGTKPWSPSIGSPCAPSTKRLSTGSRRGRALTATGPSRRVSWTLTTFAEPNGATCRRYERGCHSTRCSPRSRSVTSSARTAIDTFRRTSQKLGQKERHALRRYVFVPPEGFEPSTNRLRGECSARLSYGGMLCRSHSGRESSHAGGPTHVGVDSVAAEGDRRVSNPRPPRPQRGALAN